MRWRFSELSSHSASAFGKTAITGCVKGDHTRDDTVYSAFSPMISWLTVCELESS